MIKTLLGIVESMPPPTPTATAVASPKKSPIVGSPEVADDSAPNINRPWAY